MMRILLWSISYLLLISLFACGDDASDDIDTSLPLTVFINNASAAEQENLTFEVTLNRRHDAPIDVTYSTQDGTAQAGRDYVAQTATLTFAPGEMSQSITIEIIDDTFFEPRERLNVVLSEVSAPAIFLGDMAAGTIDSNDSARSASIPDAGYTSPMSYEGMELVWADEFDGDSVDESNWTFEIGNGIGGWGNNELQYYTDRNASIQDGHLVITAEQEAINGFNYSSTRMITKGKQEFQYGRIDIRATMPFGNGLWPALWMLGANFEEAGWPACGEIDIMELIGRELGTIHGTVHYGADFSVHRYTGNSVEISGGNTWDEFHVYSILWGADKIEWYLDDQKYFEYERGTEVYPFNAPFFFIFNVAVGGNWPGSPDGTSIFPQRMVVDYVRVFQ